MKTKALFLFFMFCLPTICITNLVNAQTTNSNFKEIKGTVVDSKTNIPLIFTDLILQDSNISTITNSDGEFLLKIPNDFLEGSITTDMLRS